MNYNKLFVLGIDGMPFSLLQNPYIMKHMPFLLKLSEEMNLKQMNSVYPVVSSVAWTSFATGVNPGEHGIYGFTDIDYDGRLYIPTSQNRKKNPIWLDLPSDKHCIVINVPSTYPPEPVHGVMVSCFLCPDIKKSTYPDTFYHRLIHHNYMIDVEAELVKTDKLKFIVQLINCMIARFDVAFELLKSRPWDYFQLHIMETDRLMHFFFDRILTPGNQLIDEYIIDFFHLLDEKIELLVKSLSDHCGLLILSDHGFCEIKSEIQLNVWMKQQGFLSKVLERSMELDMFRNCCFSLSPGRIYFDKNKKDDLIDEVIKLLDSFYLPDSNEKIIKNIFLPNEIYQGRCIDNAPDLILHPNNGFDLKSRFYGEKIFERTELTGMHTYDDAMLMSRGINIGRVNGIEELYHYIREYFNHESI